MDLRNVRRVFLVGQGLRIYRRKSGIDISPALLKYLSCMYFHPIPYSVSTVRHYLVHHGHAPRSMEACASTLKTLVSLGLAECVDNRYFISPAGRAALGQIEKCIRCARVDR